MGESELPRRERKDRGQQSEPPPRERKDRGQQSEPPLRERKTEDSRVRQNGSEMIPIITLWCVNENGNELPQRSSNEIITGLRVKRD